MIFFLNSAARVYDDTELNFVPGVLFEKGVFNTLKDSDGNQASRALWKIGGDFLIEPAGGTLNVTAKPGAATVAVLGNVGSTPETQQAVIKEDNQLSAAVAENASLAIRADAVVLRVDQSIITDDDLNAAGSNAVSLVVISGNSANALEDQEIAIALSGDPYIRLADIFVPQNATEITASMITDRRELPKMTRSVKMASDSFQFYALTSDPDTLEAGDVWFNTTDGILKFYDGTNTIALQTRDFDWGYYPPDGVDQNADDFDPTIENDSAEGTSSMSFRKTIDVNGGGNSTSMAGQVFVFPNVLNPFVRVKMANPLYQAGVEFTVYTVDGSNDPDTLVEDVASFAPGDTPINDYVEFYLDGSLYTPGNTYILVARARDLGFINAGDSDFKTAQVATSSYPADDYFVGTKSGAVASIQTLPTSLTWGSLSANQQFVMSIGERDEIAVGETDSAGNNYLLSQGFTPKSQDIIGFRVLKGEDIGSPTGDITAYLYAANEDNEPTGNVLTSATIAEADWGSGSAGDEKIFEIMYDQLVIGSRYVIVLDAETHDDDNTYTVFFGTSPNGRAKRNNTADGWVSLNGDLFYAILTSPVRKIVVTGNDGLIPAALIPVKEKRVTTLASNATPSYNIETADAIVIPALATNITDMSTNQIGTPYDFQELTFRITASGGVRTVAWGTLFASTGVTLDTSIASGKTLTARFIYNSVTSKFDLISTTETP